eukprot:TRINITY_DN72_c2_g1_i1.p1 TRINITY_DN72_c2_g1~~TRINITY_DN72_c2_g1_i1.p1  ORF type:complete len:136 (-),score=20.46 TRINITY_DN72_c2_g1_i1:121-477(-)
MQNPLPSSEKQNKFFFFFFFFFFCFFISYSKCQEQIFHQGMEGGEATATSTCDPTDFFFSGALPSPFFSLCDEDRYNKECENITKMPTHNHNLCGVDKKNEKEEENGNARHFRKVYVT